MPLDIATNQLEKNVREIEERRERFSRELNACVWTFAFCTRMKRYLDSLRSSAIDAQTKFQEYSSQDWKPRDNNLRVKIQNAMDLCETNIPLLEQRLRQLGTSSPNNAPNLTESPATS